MDHTRVGLDGQKSPPHTRRRNEAIRYRLVSSGEAEQIADELQRALEVVEAPERRTAVLSAVQQITLAPKLGLVYVQIDEQCSIVCEVTFAYDTTWNPYAK